MAGREEEDDVLSIKRDLPSSVNLKTTVLNNFEEQGIIKDGKFHSHYETPVGMMELAKMSFDVYGHDREFGKVFSEIASDASKKGPFGLSPVGIAKMSMFGSGALSGKDKWTHWGAAKINKAPDYIPGIVDITQGYYTDSDGNQQPISNQGIAPTDIKAYSKMYGNIDTGLSVNTNPLGLLNEQPASGPISASGGQPYHHISGLLDVGKNLKGIEDSEDYKDILKDKGSLFGLFRTVMAAISGRQPHPGLGNVVEKVVDLVDDEDKLASVYT